MRREKRRHYHFQHRQFFVQQPRKRAMLERMQKLPKLGLSPVPTGPSEIGGRRQNPRSPEMPNCSFENMGQRCHQETTVLRRILDRPLPSDMNVRR